VQYASPSTVAPGPRGDHRGILAERSPVFAIGRYVEQTMADRPSFDRSIAGGVVQSGQMAHIDSFDPSLSEYTIPGTPVDEREAIVVVPLVVGDDVIGTLNVWREGGAAPSFSAEEAQLIRRFAAPRTTGSSGPRPPGRPASRPGCRRSPEAPATWSR
jgi:hypothetical protein